MASITENLKRYWRQFTGVMSGRQSMMGLQGAMRISKQNAAIEKRQNKSSQQKYRIWRKRKRNRVPKSRIWKIS